MEFQETLQMFNKVKVGQLCYKTVIRSSITSPVRQQINYAVVITRRVTSARNETFQDYNQIIARFEGFYLIIAFKSPFF